MPGYVAFRQSLFRIGEDLRGVAHLDEPAKVEKGRALGNPRRLVHGMGDDDDGVLAAQLVDCVKRPICYCKTRADLL